MSQLLLGDNEYCLKLANYLRQRLNERYVETRSTNTDLPERIIVRSIRNYDDISVPLTEFPLLKVYRTNDTYKTGTQFRKTNAVLTYAVTYPDLNILPDLLYWTSWQINYLLLEYKKSTLHSFPGKVLQDGYNCEYLLREMSNTIFPFIRFQLSFNDHLSQKLI